MKKRINPKKKTKKKPITRINLKNKACLSASLVFLSLSFKKATKKLCSHGFGEPLLKSLTLKLCHTPFYVGAGTCPPAFLKKSGAKNFTCMGAAKAFLNSFALKLCHNPFFIGVRALARKKSGAKNFTRIGLGKLY